MTPEQKRWFKRLKKCLSDMPEQTEISVCVIARSISYIHLHNLGDIERIEHDDYDRMQADVGFGEVALDCFTAENVIPNSECI